MFTGAMMMLCRGGDRVPVVNLGIVPLGIRSRDTAPFGLGIPPLPGALGRVRNALLTVVADRVVFASLQRFAQQLVGATTGGRLTTPFLNWPALADAVVQFTVPGFEYPRGDLPDTVRFVGPMSRTQPSGVALPDWWNDLDGSRPVVHVTQGTVANRDLGALIEPTIEGLADMGVLVVVSTGGRDLPDRALPAHVRVAPYLPYDQLLPRTDALVTNGGYGGVHYAMEHGVPLVTAGRTEDKIEVTARVAWSGVGIDLRGRCATPSGPCSRTRATASAAPRAGPRSVVRPGWPGSRTSSRVWGRPSEVTSGCGKKCGETGQAGSGWALASGTDTSRGVSATRRVALR